MRLSLILFFCAALLLAACGKGADEAAAPEPTATVHTVAAGPGQLAETIDVYGRAEFDPNSLQTLVSPVEARLASLNVAVGQTVPAGTVVATLQASPASVLEADKAGRDAAAAQTEYERLARLQADGLAATSEVETARANAANAQEAARSLRARTGGGLIVVRMARTGVVDSLPATVGDLIPAGGAVAKLGGDGPLRARLGVEPDDARRLAPGFEVRVGGLGSQGLLGRVQSVDRRVDPATRLAGVLVVLPAGTGFLPGQTLKGQIVARRRTAAVAVPRAAILYDGEAPYVFVAVGGKAVRKPVKLGLDDGTTVEILDGVAPGQRVVVEGGSALDDGMKLREAPAAGEAR